MSVKTRLVLTLASAGVPVDTVAITGIASANVTYMEWATQAQRDQGAAILATFDWSDAAEQTYQDSLSPEKAAIRTTVVQMLADLDQYLTIADTATAAQVRTAVKVLAQDTRRVVVYLAKQING